MSLQKQKISIPLVSGITTKTDDKQQQIGSIDDLENCLFDEPGKLIKRNGYDKVDTILLDNSTISEAQRLTSFGNELCVFNKTNFYSYSESTNRWTNKGTVSNIFPISKSIIRNTHSQQNSDSVHVAGLNVFAWEDSRNGIRCSIIDNNTDNELLSDTEITATGSKPRVEAIGNFVYIIYIDGTSIKYKKINPIRPNSIGSEQTITSDLHASNKIYDTVTVQNKIFVAWNSSTSTLKILTVSENGTLSSEIEEGSESPSISINLNNDSDSNILISYYNGTEVKAIVKSYNLGIDIISATVIETIANITNVSILTTDNITYKVLYEQSAANTYDHLIRQNTINTSAIIGTPSDFIRSCGLASKQFIQNSKCYVAVIHNSELQSTIYILNSDAEVVSKISQGLSGDLLSFGNLPKVSQINENILLLSTQIKGKTISESNTIFSLLGVNSTKLDFGSDTRFDNASLGLQLHTNGGMIQSYDGKEIVEHGFHVFPENIENHATATTGGNISDGTFFYSAVYTWTDNRGQKHRSAPSIPLQVTLSGGTATQTQDIKIPTLRITEKSNVVIELYRTESSGTVFYKVTSDLVFDYNDKTVDYIIITDNTSDNDLIDNEILYTTGGILDNIAPPSASIIETFNNRIFLAGLEDENQIQYSKIRQESSPVEFNDTLLINVNARGGAIIALASMDDKLIIFKENAIFYLSGDGPNNLGQQNTFITPELITEDLGCETQNSIVLTPIGLMFKSKKGIYVLNKSLQHIYIGADVEDYNDLNIKSANIVPQKNIIIFITNGKALVYDYLVGKWATYTNHVGISATYLNGTYYYLRQNNEIYKEASHYTDNGSFIKMKLQTSWMSFAGVQGFQRVYRMLILGKYKSAHKLKIKVAYDFNEAFIQEKLIDTSDFSSDNIYGEQSPYGTGIYGGSANKYQIRVNMKKQKCESIKIVIEDNQSSNYGEGLELSNLLFVVGAKRGDFKLPQSNTYGTN